MKKGTIGPVNFMINPSTVKVTRTASFSDMNVPFIESPTYQYTGGSGRKIDCELILDFTQGDVEQAIESLDKLAKKKSKDEAPEIVDFEFGDFTCTGSIESLTITRTKFTAALKCIGARAAISFIEIAEEGGKTRLDEKGIRSYIVENNDTFFNIASKEEVFGNETLWKAIADYNPDPYQKSMFLTPGVEVKIPPGDTILDDYEQEVIEGQVPWA